MLRSLALNLSRSRATYLASSALPASQRPLLNAASFASAAAQPEASPTVPAGIEGRYANALYMAAVKAKNLPAVTADMARLNTLFKDSLSFSAFLADPTLPRAIKSSTLDRALKKAGDFSDVSTQFLRVVAENGRAKDMGAIFAAFQSMASTDSGEITVKVVSATPLNEWTIEYLKMQVVNKFYADKPNVEIALESTVDESLIGGLTIQVEDKFVDMSQKTEIKKITELVSKIV